MYIHWCDVDLIQLGDNYRHSHGNQHCHFSVNLISIYLASYSFTFLTVPCLVPWGKLNNEWTSEYELCILSYFIVALFLHNEHRYDNCLEVKRKIIRTVRCESCVGYSYMHIHANSSFQVEFLCFFSWQKTACFSISFVCILFRFLSVVVSLVVRISVISRLERFVFPNDFMHYYIKQRAKWLQERFITFIKLNVWR